MAQQGGVYDPEKEKKGEPARPSPRRQLPPSDEGLRHMTGIDGDDEEAIDKDASQHAESGGFYNSGNNQGGVYDPENGETAYHSPRPQLPQSNEAGIDKDALQNAESGGFYNAGASQAGKSASPSSLSDSEEAGDEDDGYASGFDSDNSSKGRKRKLLAAIVAKRSKLWIFGAIGGGGIIALFTGILLLIPLKIESIIQNLENRFFSIPELSVNIVTDRFFSEYVVKHVVGSYKNCGTTRDRNCHVAIYAPGTNAVTNLYRAWAQDRLEQKLYTDYGISFNVRGDGRLYMVVDDVTKGAGDYVGKDGDNLYSFLVGHPDLKAIVNNGLEGETLSTKLLFRYKIGRLFKVKYEQPRCIFFCDTRGKISNTIKGYKDAAKIAVTQRVIAPYNQALGIALECILTNCDATKTQPTDPNADPEEDAFPANADTDTAIRVTMGDVAAQYAGADLTQAQKLYQEISTEGYSRYLTIHGVAAITGDEVTGEAVADAVPLIGWANLAANLYQDASKIGPTIKKLRYLIVVPAAIDLYLTYRTETDEVHTGNVNGTDLGSMTASLGPGDNGNPSDPEVGGKASAEQAPLYASINNDSSNYASNTASLFSSILPGNVFADSPSGGSTDSGAYLCNNGKPVPAGQTVCPEEVVGGGNVIANSVHTFLSTDHLIDGILFPGREITAVAAIWNSTVGWVANLVGETISTLAGDFISTADGVLSTACDVPGSSFLPGIGAYCAGRDLIQKAIPVVLKAFEGALFPSPIGTNMSGARTYEVAAMGADASSNQYTQEGLGGHEVSPAVTAAMFNQAQNQSKLQFEHESFFARMFDTNSTFSLVSTLALATPTDLQTSVDSGFGSLIGDPLSLLSNGFASLFSGSNDHASAAAFAHDPFQIPQYAATVPNGDLEAYWARHCSENAAQAYESDADYNSPTGQNGRIGNWDQDTANTVDPADGMPESKTSDPCLILKTATGVAGGKFDSSLLTADDLADINGSPGGGSGSGAPTTGSSSPDCTSATGNAKILCQAEQYKGIYYLGGGGHGYSAFEQGCPASTLSSAASNSTASNPGPCATDCSGLVSVAVDGAFGQNFSWDVGGIETSSQDWKAINITSVQPGDVVTVGTDTHVEIVDHYDASSGTLYTFGSHQTGQQTSQISSPTSAWNGAYTYIGPGSS